MIEKRTAIITSLGRTATTFLAGLFRDHFSNVASVHEPETIKLKNFNVTDSIRPLRDFGFTNVVLGKAMGTWGLMNLSNMRIAGRISREGAAEKVIRQRKAYVEGFQKDLYIESSYHYYGLLDVLPLSFRTFRALYVVRDPRDWVTSNMNYGFWYHPANPHTVIGDRITPHTAGDASYRGRWKHMRLFEKLCWAWTFINTYAIESMGSLAHMRMYRFEDLFDASNGYQGLIELVRCATDFNAVDPGQRTDVRTMVAHAAKKKINEPAARRFPGWRSWGREDARDLQRICGVLMERLGYGKEPGWREKLG
jgi:hypothetical protein